MNVFAVSFRIHDDATYDDRYNTTQDAIIAHAAGRQWWAETTSFFLLKSNMKSKDLAAAINNNSKFDERKDLLVVINLDQSGYCVLGKHDDDTIKTLLNARKLVAS